MVISTIVLGVFWPQSSGKFVDPAKKYLKTDWMRMFLSNC